MAIIEENYGANMTRRVNSTWTLIFSLKISLFELYFFNVIDYMAQSQNFIHSLFL